MPMKTRRGKSRKQTMQRRKTSKNRSSKMVVNTAISPFAQRYICKLKYSEVFQTSALSPIYRFNLNSLFDPNRSGGGHQAHGFDQLSPLYNRYRVFGCSYVINFYNATTAGRACVLPANDEVNPTGVSDACENPRARWAITVPNARPSQIKGYVSMPSLMGRSKAAYVADDRFQSTMSASPAENAILNIFTADLTDAGLAMQCTVTLVYHAEFFDVKTFNQS